MEPIRTFETGNLGSKSANQNKTWQMIAHTTKLRTVSDMTTKDNPLYACPSFGILMEELNSLEIPPLLEAEGPGWMTMTRISGQ